MFQQFVSLTINWRLRSVIRHPFQTADFDDKLHSKGHIFYIVNPTWVINTFCKPKGIYLLEKVIHSFEKQPNPRLPVVCGKELYIGPFCAMVFFTIVSFNS